MGAGCLGLIGLLALLWALLATDALGGEASVAPVYPIPPLPAELAVQAPAPTGAPTPTATAVPTATPAPDLPASYVVANTGGLGAALRREPGNGERIRAWQDGTTMVEVGPERQVGPQVWKNVRDPAGNVGWIAADLLAVSPRATAQAVATGSAGPTAAPTPSPAAVAEPLPPPCDLELLAVDSYRQGGLVVVEGRISNVGRRALSLVWAVAQWYDRQWQPVKSFSAPIRQDPLLPAQSSPFRVVATDHPDIAYYTIDFREAEGDFLLVRVGAAGLR